MSQRTDEFPTMIIPKGTEIKVNEKGQLSIKTPGNLVIQNSGNYSLISSERGSVKVEPGVNVEAIEVSAADTCLVQGNLSAWRLRSKKLCLEDRAQAFIMLQEAQELELAKSARLVGNFSSDKEIYLMLGKFAPQLKGLPTGMEVIDSAQKLPEAAPPPSPSRQPLQMALVLLEREFALKTYDPDSLQAIKEIIDGLKSRDPNRLRQIFTLFSAMIREPSPDIQKAFALIRENI
jgi:hypothetical protein